jgi:hypothetical protein
MTIIAILKALLSLSNALSARKNIVPGRGICMKSSEPKNARRYSAANASKAQIGRHYVKRKSVKEAFFL